MVKNSADIAGVRTVAEQLELLLMASENQLTRGDSLIHRAPFFFKSVLPELMTGMSSDMFNQWLQPGMYPNNQSQLGQRKMRP